MSFLVDTKIQINGYLRFEDNWKMFLYDYLSLSLTHSLFTLSACEPTFRFDPSPSIYILISVHTHTQQFMIGKHKYTIKFSFSSHKKQIIWNWNCFFIIITYCECVCLCVHGFELYAKIFCWQINVNVVINEHECYFIFSNKRNVSSWCGIWT